MGANSDQLSSQCCKSTAPSCPTPPVAYPWTHPPDCTPFTPHTFYVIQFFLGKQPNRDDIVTLDLFLGSDTMLTLLAWFEESSKLCTISWIWKKVEILLASKSGFHKEYSQWFKNWDLRTQKLKKQYFFTIKKQFIYHICVQTSSGLLNPHPRLHLAGCQCWILFYALLHEVQSGNRQLAGMTTPLLRLSYGVILIFSGLAGSVGFYSNFFFMRSKVATDS
jgi:hypothetical protein